MRFPLKKLLLTVSAICLLGLLSIGGILKPALNSKEDSDGTANSDPEVMQQKSLRMPLVVRGIGLQEQAEHNVTATNFTEKHIVINVTRTIEETVSKLVYEKNLKKSTAKKETEAKKTIELQKYMERHVKEKSSTKSIKKNPLVSAKPSPAPIEDNPTDNQSRKLSKKMKRVNITYDNPKKYKGPHVEGWPPGKDRYMPNYIQPDHDTFPIRPSKAHFKGCEILVIVQSAIDDFSMRMGLRDTWIQFVTQKRVANVSVIFLIGNQNAFNNVTASTQ